MRKIHIAFLSIFFLSLFLVSCSNDAYETGDSRYSYLRADFVEANTNSQAQLVSAITDNDVSLSFSKPSTVSWMTTADSTYRALLYYNIGVGNGDKDNGSAMTVEPVSIRMVYVLNPALNPQDTTDSNHKPQTSTLKSQTTDPVHFQSSWLNANHFYANLSLALMTGVADSIDAVQSMGLCCDSVIAAADGHHTYYYRFLHSQNNVPQYYKTTVYVSIPTKRMTTGDVVRLSLNTYDGWITREFRL